MRKYGSQEKEMSGADLKFCEEGRESPFILGNLKVNHGERIHGTLSLGRRNFFFR